MPLPQLVNIDCTRYSFQPGDRILIRSFGPLTNDQQRKIRKSIEKWAGASLEVLFVDKTQFDVAVLQHSRVKTATDLGQASG